MYKLHCKCYIIIVKFLIQNKSPNSSNDLKPLLDYGTPFVLTMI